MHEGRMGLLPSKKKKLREWDWSGPPGEHSPYPVDRVTYSGPQLLYCFIDILTSYQFMENSINLGPSVVTTNVQKFKEDLDECYRQGFTLREFVKVPGVKSTTEVQDWTAVEPYQAILSKQQGTSGNPEEVQKWTLAIEKRIMSTKATATDASEQNDLIRTIDEYAARGARLICAEQVGYVRPTSGNYQYGVLGVDIFFNVPLSNPTTRYTYHAVDIPIRYYIVPDVTQTLQRIECDADWMGNMKFFMSEGWKLVEICMDSTSLAQAYGMKTASTIVDTIWIFEKETQKLYDMRPRYEGVIIEYLHKVKNTLHGEVPCKDWRPVIAGMGVSGWELATIIQTPILIQSSFTTYRMKLLMFFQRRIMNQDVRDLCRTYSDSLQDKSSSLPPGMDHMRQYRPIEIRENGYAIPIAENPVALRRRRPSWDYT